MESSIAKAMLTTGASHMTEDLKEFVILLEDQPINTAMYGQIINKCWHQSRADARVQQQG